MDFIKSTRVLRRIFPTGGGASQHVCMKPSSVVYVDTATKKKKKKRKKEDQSVHMLSIQKRPKKSRIPYQYRVAARHPLMYIGRTLSTLK